VSIIPRGRALGVTMFLPEQDRYSYSKQRLFSQLCGLYGGRIAEELIFGADAVTTGASNDIERATDIARNMVTRWGLSDELGPLAYGEEKGEVFLGHSVGQRQEISDETAKAIDSAIKDIADRAYQRAQSILEEHMDMLHLMSDALMKYETIDESQIAQIKAGQTPDAPEGWDEPKSGAAADTGDGDASAKSEGDSPSSDVAGGDEQCTAADDS